MASEPRENRLRVLLEGCGAGILLMFRYVWLHLSPVHVDLYHRLLPMNAVYGAVAIDLVIICAVCSTVLWLLDHFDANGRTLVWIIVATVCVTQTWAFFVWLGDINVHTLKPVWLALICLVSGVALWLWQKPLYQKGVMAGRAILALLGICIVWILPQLIYMAIHKEPHDVQSFVRPVPAAQMPQRRIIWILFDELSQDQTFDHRQPGMSLPALDQFRSQSVMFSDVNPAGFYTELVVPSLLWGHTITDERSDLSGNIYVKTSAHGWQAFPADKSIFADAQQDGWSTGIAGWYNAYCRTYGPWLNWCAWMLHAAIPGNYLQGKSLWWNVNAPLVRTESKLLGREYRIPSSAEIHAADYEYLIQKSHELIDDEKIGFIFLHLPLPHPGGFYDRKTGELGVNGSYLDNLALTDKTLSELMEWIGKTSLASKTTVVICSDHSWRVGLWRVSPMWTKEDELASRGKIDTRPVLMVHFSGETTPEVISQSFPAIQEHALIELLLRGPMTPDELKRWANLLH
jgi:Sulfatase